MKLSSRIASIVMAASVISSIAIPVTALNASASVVPSTQAILNNQTSSTLAAINAERVKAGVGQVTIDPSISVVSQGWANKLAAQSGVAVSHNPDMDALLPNNGTISEIVAVQGDSGFKDGDYNGYDAVKSWMNSYSHRKAMLDGRYTKIGVGVAVYSSSIEGLPMSGNYWVVNLASKSASDPNPGSGPANVPTPTPTNNTPTQPDYIQHPDGSRFYNGIRVAGLILDKYTSVGSSLGLPVAYEFGPLKNGGYGQHFQNGSVYWSQDSGAQVIKGAIRDRYSSMGWESSYLGYPTSGEISVRGGVLQRFQGGLIYSSSATGAQAIRGAILDKFGNFGYENGRMGFPTTSEIGIRGGAFTAFQGGSVYWSPSTGAHAVFGAIRDTWGTVGWENGFGFPTTDEFGPLKGGGYGQHFQGGSIYWSKASGGHTISGAFRNSYAAQGWEGGRLGYPTSQEYRAGSEVRQNFQGGYMVWNGRTVTVR